MLIPILRDPVAATFMLAKQLSDLRNVDFKGVAGDKLSIGQLAFIAARNNEGPEDSITQIKQEICNGYETLRFIMHVQLILQH